MKPAHFIYSETQRQVVLDMDPNKEIHHVYINGKFTPYTEINSTGDSNFEDAQHLGVHPRHWVKQGGKIQDGDLADFINNNGHKR